MVAMILGALERVALVDIDIDIDVVDVDDCTGRCCQGYK
jgi:hypothetical protein